MRRSLRTVVVGSFVALLAGCSAAGNVFDLAEGDCFDLPTEESGEVSDVEVVDCDQPHDAEAYHAFDLSDADAYPGPDELEDAIEEGCLGDAFTDYVGGPYAESELYLSPMSPTEASWEEGDREILCALELEDGQLEGSVEGTGR